MGQLVDVSSPHAGVTLTGKVISMVRERVFPARGGDPDEIKRLEKSRDSLPRTRG